MPAARTLRGAAALCALGAIVAAAGTRLERRSNGVAAGRTEAVYLPDARWLRPLDLGYHNVLADVLWFRTISYFGDHYQTDRSYPWLARMCDLVTDLDPRAEHVYRFAGLVLPWEGGQVGEGIRLLEKGLRTFPDSWTLHYHLGLAQYLFGRDLAQAGEHLKQAARQPGVPPIVVRLAALLEARRYGPQTTLEFLRELRSQPGTEPLQEVLEHSIREAQLASDLEQLDARVATYRERFGRLPASLEALVEAGLLTGIPPDPFGGSYQLDPESGQARSSTGHVPLQIHESPRWTERRGGSGQ